ncbi:MAG TPA: potassium-transporting ATPase subunit KdpA, partial [Gaiellaceae bacterium]|nr:potassium-transporting ATPase subunit KdpA [Gaiellaceae bacterium]
MSGQGIGQIVSYAAALVALAYPLGLWMARVYTRERGDAVERGLLRLLRPRSGEEQDWKRYAKTVLVFSVVFSALLYAIQRLQGHLFLNPDHMRGVPAHLALNTTASFVTNTNWQFYGGESTMSYLTQMAGLAVQNFVSAAVGMAVLAAVVRGIARRSSSGLGNFWRDLYRSLVYVLLPLAVVLAAILISQGVPQTFHGHATATTLQGAQQVIGRGPVGSQVAIKQLGTNGGGFHNSNSSVPFENP